MGARSNQVASLLALSVVVLGLHTDARGAVFDEATGKLLLDGAVAIGFERGTDGAVELPSAIASFSSLGPIAFPGRVIYGPGGAEVTLDEQLREDELSSARVVELPELALEGESVFELGGDLVRINIDIDVADLVGRRVEVRLWQRSQGTLANAGISWRRGGVLDLSLGHVGLYPTGRATTDGWREYTSGPVDWGIPGLTDGALLWLADAQDGMDYGSGLAPYYQDVSVLIDAIEVIDVGPAAVPDAACSLPTQDDCGSHGLCVYGRCLDAAAFAGRLLTGEFRSHYLQRRIEEVRLFSGARSAEPRFESFEAALTALDRDDVSARELWTTLRTAYRDLLADGHSYAAELTTDGAVNASLCLHLGEPDLLPDAGARAPMVFEAPSGDMAGVDFWSTRLEAGDVLVAIDGVDPEAWSELAALYLPQPTEPDARFNAYAPDLVPAAIRTGAELVFHRCEPSEPTTPCAAGEVEVITIDLAEELAPLWDPNEFPPGTVFPTTTVCDYRFGRVVADPTARSAYVMAYADVDGVRVVQVNGTFAPPPSVAEAFGPSADRIVIDHRNGLGGVRSTEALLSSFLMSEEDYDQYEVYPPVDVPFTEALRGAFLDCHDRGGLCGGLDVLENVDHGGARLNADARVAVINGFGISSSDFLSMHLSLREGAPTRLFGAVPSAGGFGGPIALPPYGNERRGAWVAREDLMFIVDGESTGFLTGTGVAPDEIVLQRQSDALRGIDTALEAALQWVNQE